jgi:hypothetical protein
VSAVVGWIPPDRHHDLVPAPNRKAEPAVHGINLVELRTHGFKVQAIQLRTRNRDRLRELEAG